jgi:hypothetical protein
MKNLSEDNLALIYTNAYRQKSLELRNLCKELIDQARDKPTALQIEFATISIQSSQYFLSKFVQKVLEIEKLNYNLGGNFKELVNHIRLYQESFIGEKKSFYENNPNQRSSIRVEPKRILGISLPIAQRIKFESNYDPYLQVSELETEKDEEKIIKLFAEIKASTYYFKRVWIKNDRFKEKGKISTKEKNQFMEELLQDIINQAPEITKFIALGLAKGGLAAQGKELFEKVKSWFPEGKSHTVLKELELKPEDAKQIGKVEFLLEQKLSELSEKELREFYTLYSNAKKESSEQISYISTIGDNSSGNVIVQGSGNIINQK